MLGNCYRVKPVLRMLEITLRIPYKKGIFRAYFKDHDAMGTASFAQAGGRYT